VLIEQGPYWTVVCRKFELGFKGKTVQDVDGPLDIAQEQNFLSNFDLEIGILDG
jgi:hypothetical protein